MLVQQGLSLSDQFVTGLDAGSFHAALREIKLRGYGALVIPGDRLAQWLSMALDDVQHRQAIPFTGWALAARALGKLGFDHVDLPDAPADDARALGPLRTLRRVHIAGRVDRA